jgi:hypothetical protein
MLLQLLEDLLDLLMRLKEQLVTWVTVAAEGGNRGGYYAAYR